MAQELLHQDHQDVATHSAPLSIYGMASCPQGAYQVTGVGPKLPAPLSTETLSDAGEFFLSNWGLQDPVDQAPGETHSPSPNLSSPTLPEDPGGAHESKKNVLQ
jgi:hypothetical protein